VAFTAKVAPTEVGQFKWRAGTYAVYDGIASWSWGDSGTIKRDPDTSLLKGTGDDPSLEAGRREFRATITPGAYDGSIVSPQTIERVDRPSIVRVDGVRLYDLVAGSVAETVHEPGSIGVIAPDAAVKAISKALSRKGVDHGMLGADHGDVDHQVDVVPATVAKGLEFDRVIVVEPSAIAAAEPDRRTGLRRLYVVLTRAVSELTVFHSDELPVELAG